MRKNHINLRQVEIFRATMKLGTVTAAAAALGSSQPTITRELSRLEEHIGFTLFERRLQRLVPTARAIKLFEEVQASFIGLDRINEFVGRLREASEEVLTVASLPALAQTILPEAVARLCKEHPHLTLQISSVDPRNQTSVSGYNFDIGLVEDAYTNRDAEAEVLWAFQLVAVMTADHPLAKYETLCPRDFEDVNFISLGQHDPYRLIIERLFDNEEVSRKLFLSARSASTVCELVLKKLGVSIVNPLTALSYEDKGLIIKPFLPAQDFVISYIRPINRPAVASSKALLAHLRMICAEIEQELIGRNLAQMR